MTRKRTVSIALACVGVGLLMVRALASLAVTTPPGGGAASLADGPHQAIRDGVWIWTRTDAAVFANRGDLALNARPGVLVLSIDDDGAGALVGRRGLSPASVGAVELAAVVRIEDAVAPHLANPSALLAELDARLASLRRELDDGGTKVAEVQLDFDVPVRRLDAWASVAGGVAASSLAGVPVWVTSVPSHLADARYGALFQPAVAGHVYQVFDTGLGCNPAEIARARDHLERAAMPYRIGVATFEREKNGAQTTQHACWASATRVLWTSPRYAGAWVFPAGRTVDVAFAMLQPDGT